MAKKKQSSKEAAAPRRKRRGIDQMIADLEAKIAVIKERDARKKAKSDPALRHVGAALKAIDKAQAALQDGASRRSLGEARAALESVLARGGASAGSDQGGAVRTRRSAHELQDLASSLLTYVRSNPGQRGEQIAEALSSDTSTIRPVMKRLIADGKITTEGQRRGMTYSAV